MHVCPIPGCGACFKRREHVKRHVRGIHTLEKVNIRCSLRTDCTITEHNLHRSALSLLAQWLREKLRKTGQSRITLYQSVRLETISRSDADDPVLQRFTKCPTGNAYNCLPRETKRFDTKVIVPALCILGFMLVSRLYRRSKTTLSPPYLCASSSYRHFQSGNLG